jgi:hypothetical protein
MGICKKSEIMRKFKIKNLILKKILESNNKRVDVTDLVNSISEISLTFNDVYSLCKEMDNDGNIILKKCNSKDGDCSFIELNGTKLFMSKGGYKWKPNYSILAFVITLIGVITTIIKLFYI